MSRTLARCRQQPRLTVWYNTRCPVCDAGIVRQRNKLLALVKAGAIEFRDINLEPDALAAHGATLDDIRRRLHATDDTGRLLVGADVVDRGLASDAGRGLAGDAARQSGHAAGDALRLRSLRGCAVGLEPAQGAVVMPQLLSMQPHLPHGRLDPRPRRR